MRHRVKINHLGRTTAHRKSMLANMASSLIKQKRIETTVAKAKELKIFVEPIINKSKEDTTHSRRVVFSYLQDKEAVTELFREVAGKIASRPGGYTRILRTRSRPGDNADMCMIELVDYNTTYTKAGTEAATKASTRRGRRGPKKAEAKPVKEQAEKAAEKEGETDKN
jgi:large subunit ribosomal protein L17